MNAHTCRLGLCASILLLLPRVEASPQPECFTFATAVDLDSYLPEGDSAGDELKPAAASKDLTINCSWSGSGGPRQIVAFLFSSNLQGMCTNSGDLTLPDFTVEASRNPEWTIQGADISEYAGTQSSNTVDFSGGFPTAITTNPVPAGTVVPLKITSYDWGGTCVVRVVATPIGECVSALPVVAPQDGDGDKLPDKWEDESGGYYKADRTFVPKYDKGMKKSDGLQAESDDEDDSDLDARATPVHTAFGDGLNAFDEYRGLTIKGVTQRTTELANDGPGGGKGGTHVKDLCVFDGRVDKTTAFFTSTNGFLQDYAVIWHLIEKKDMTDEGEKAGFVDKNSDKKKLTQRAIWLERRNGLVRNGTQLLGDSQDFSVNSGLKILLNHARMKVLAAASGASEGDIIDFVTAHEIGHKLTLQHNEGKRTRVAAMPATPNLTDWWEGQTAKHLDFWVPAFTIRGGQVQALDVLEKLEKGTGGPEPPEVQMDRGIVQAPADVNVAVHTVNHTAAIYEVQTKTAIQQAETPPTIKTQAHAKNVMDPIPHPDDLAAIKTAPLTTAA